MWPPESAKAATGRQPWRRHLDSATALARENLSAARRSVRALHPEPLDTATLPEALTDVATRWSERTGVPATFTATGEPRPLHPEIESTVLRVTQEALSNVDKHAAAGRVGLTLSFTPGPGPGFGLPGMRRRVERLAGTLHVESEPGGGTAISAVLPAVPSPPEAAP
jgi:signal transduction histidine kinase